MYGSKQSKILLLSILLLFISLYTIGNKKVENKVNNANESVQKNKIEKVGNYIEEAKTYIGDLEKVENEISQYYKGEYEYSEYYLKPNPINLSFNYKFDKYKEDIKDNFVMVKNKSAYIKSKPNYDSETIKEVKYTQKFYTIGKVNVSGDEWYEVKVGENIGYIPSKNVLKREYNWQDAINKIEQTNRFIENSLKSGRKPYVLNHYAPLKGAEGVHKDKYGNRNNHSDIGYFNSNFKGGFIYIPDRTLIDVIEETDNYIKVKIDIYDKGEFYLRKSSKRNLKETEITKPVERYIYVDRNSQNEMILEKTENSNKWNVVTASFVTTGKDTYTSYATPYGVFLIAYSKDTMFFTDNTPEHNIVGYADKAIRFSGGGYMHGLPAKNGTYAERKAIKATVARKIGVYQDSQKCIRHNDDQINFIYEWLGNSSPNSKNGFRVPEKPTIMISV